MITKWGRATGLSIIFAFILTAFTIGPTYANTNHAGKLQNSAKGTLKAVSIDADGVETACVEGSPDQIQVTAFLDQFDTAQIYDDAVWTDTTDGREYHWEVMQAVSHLPIGTCTDPDQWAYHTTMLCWRFFQGRTANNSCNFAANNAALQRKPCEYAVACTWETPWGSRDFGTTQQYSASFPGILHTVNYGYTLRSQNPYMRVRFWLVSGGSHLSHVYYGCSGYVESWPDFREWVYPSCAGITSL